MWTSVAQKASFFLFGVVSLCGIDVISKEEKLDLHVLHRMLGNYLILRQITLPFRKDHLQM